MKKILILNGGPRMHNNTAKLLTAAGEGAVSAGASTETVDLYKLNFTDCRSCLACKNKKMAVPWKCYWRDGLTETLQKVYEADAIIIGSPIFFGEPTGVVRSFMVRSTFPALSYDDYQSTFPGKIDVAVILTMNADQNYYEKHYQSHMEEYFQPFHYLNGTTEILTSFDTLQVPDYSRYRMASWDEEKRKPITPSNSRKTCRRPLRLAGDWPAVSNYLVMKGIKAGNLNIGYNGLFYTLPYFLLFLLKCFLTHRKEMQRDNADTSFHKR